MDRLFVCATLCACLCLAPATGAREEGAAQAPVARRALWSVLYPQFAGVEEEGEEVEWYSSIWAWLRGVAA